MKLAPIGRVENVDDLDLDPIEVTVIGYTIDGDEVEHVVRFRPVQPAGAALDVLKGTDDRGNVQISWVMRFLDESVLGPDKDEWDAFLHREDVMIEQTVLVEIYKRVSEVYAQRPTPRWSASLPGGSANGMTMPAAPRSRASAASKKRTSPKR